MSLKSISTANKDRFHSLLRDCVEVVDNNDIKNICVTMTRQDGGTEHFFEIKERDILQAVGNLHYLATDLLNTYMIPDKVDYEQ